MKSWRQFFSRFRANHRSEITGGRRRGFFPIQDWEKGRNYRQQFFVHRDGTTTEAVFLSVKDKRLREEIVAKHYCKNFARLFFEGKLGESPEFFVLGRDNPWDFEVILGGSRSFNIEITSISSPAFFRTLGLENNLINRLRKESILGHDVLKLDGQFPNVFPSEFMDAVRSKDSNKLKRFRVPKGISEQLILVAGLPSFEIDVEDALRTAITKKEAKRHSQKNETVLIIDNMTMLTEPKDFFEARAALSSCLSDTPFEEVWVYTGFYSDNDGENAEYSLMPLKINSDMETVLTRHAKTDPNGTDEFGRLLL